MLRKISSQLSFCNSPFLGTAFLKPAIAIALTFAALGAAPAMAETISISQSQFMTEDGQDFTFNFSGLAPSDGNGGTITIASGASGNSPGFDLNTGMEYFQLNFDGVFQGTYHCGGLGSFDGFTHTQIPDNTGGTDCEFALVITLSGPDFDALLADALISIGVLFSEKVSHRGDGDELVVSLSYTASEVPLPAALPLFIAGMAGIGAAARRRRKLA